jgi:hypothetical protein
MLAFLNRLVMKVVSLLMYVKMAHLCVGTCVAAVCSLDASGDGMEWGFLLSPSILLLLYDYLVDVSCRQRPFRTVNIMCGDLD